MRILQSESPRPLNLLAVGPNGLVAASCDIIGVGGTVEVWTIITGGVQHRELVSDRETRGLAFTPDARFLLVAEPQAIIALDLTDDGSVPGPKPTLQYPELALSADGRHLLVTEALGSQGYVALLAMEEGPAFRTLWSEGPRADAWFKLPAISLDGSRCAVARRGSYSGGETIQVRDTRSGEVQCSIQSDPADLACQLAFSADGSTLLVRRNGRTVQLFDTAKELFDAAKEKATGELVHPRRPYVTSMAVHPGGALACARTDGTVTFWNIDERTPTRTLDWKAGRLVSVAFSADGTLGAAGTEDGKIVVWDVDV